MSEEHHTKEQQIPVYVWIVAGLILLAAGWFGFKMLIAPFQEYRVSLVDGPKDAMAGNNVAFTWRVDGPATTIHSTTVYLGTVSNPGTLGKDVKPADTRYTDFVKDFASGNFNVPLQFVGNTAVPTQGTYYYRVYAMVGDKNYWSDENTIDVKAPTAKDYSLTFLNAPAEATAGDVVPFTWSVDGPVTQIHHAAVYYGLKSNPGTLEKTVTPQETTYTGEVKDFDNGTYNIPLRFVGNEKMATPGAYFFRVHALINGNNYWTDEHTIEVKKKAPVTSTPKVAVKGAATSSAQPKATPAQ